MTSESSVHGLVDHLFRHEAGRMVAALTRFMGPARLDLSEEVVQEAMIQALRRWPFRGIPHNPAAWLHRVARNLALDRLRRDRTLLDKEPELRADAGTGNDAFRERDVTFRGEITDDQLRLIFLCCHPELPADSRVALTLKTVGGFGVREIARAILSTEAAVTQRLVRAQRRIREAGLPFEVPGPGDIAGRLDAVLEVLYLVFNEGYTAHEGGDLVRSDLCAEALRLASHMAAMPPTDRPEVHALAALLSFQASRFPARVDASGNLVVLAEQDRGLWDAPLIHRAFEHLDRASAGDRVSTYHAQAAIAALHASASSDDRTDWTAILEQYDRLLRLNPSPVVVLNRAVALARVDGSRAALEAMAGLDTHPAMRGYYLLPATRAEMHLRMGSPVEAAACYREAISCRCSEPERRFLRQKLDEAQEAAS